MCTEAGIPRKTNHSLRATGATTLFQSKVPEKIIQKTTGHRSLEALRKYKHTSTEQHQAVSKVMISTKRVDCDETLRENEPQSSCVVTRSPLEGVQKLLGDLTNCNIGHITVNIGPTFPIESHVDKEFDSLTRNVDLDIP